MDDVSLSVVVCMRTDTARERITTSKGRSVSKRIRDVGTNLDDPLGESIDVFVRREDAGRSIDEVLRDEPAAP